MVIEKVGILGAGTMGMGIGQALSQQGVGVVICDMSDAILERSLAKTAANLQGLEMAGLTLDEIDLVEVNEAFAAQVIAVMRELELDGGRLNVNGGAIALGHPTGMSGARLPLELLYSLKERGERYGLAAICGNGGNGAAMVPRDRAVAPLSRHPRGLNLHHSLITQLIHEPLAF